MFGILGMTCGLLRSRPAALMKATALLTILFVSAGIPVPKRCTAERLVRVGVYDFDPLCGAAAPFSEAAGNKGLFVRLLEHIAAQEQWQLSYVPGTLQECQARLERAEIDLLIAASYSRDLERIFDFTRESVISTWAQIYTGEKSDIQSMLDFAGTSVGVVRDDPYNHEMRTVIERLDIPCRFVQFARYSDVFAAIEKGWIDAGVVDRIYGFMHDDAFSVRKTSIMFAPVQLSFAVPRGRNNKLLGTLDYHLKILKEDQHSLYHELINTIFGDGQQSILLDVLTWCLGGAGVLLVLFSGISLMLRHQVRTRTAQLSYKNTELENEILKRSRAEKILRQQKEYFEALHETSLALIGRLNYGDILEAIISRAAALVGTRHGFIHLYDPDTQELEARVGLGVFGSMTGRRFKSGQGLGGKVLQSKAAVLIDDYACWEWRLPDSAFDHLHCVMGIPLNTHEDTAGVIGLGFCERERKFSQVEQDMLGRFAALASIVLHNAGLYDKLELELSERKKAEEARMLLLSAIEQSTESFVVIDTGGAIQYANPSFRRETGYDPEHIQNYTAFIFDHMEENLQRELKEKHRLGSSWSGRYTATRKNGAQYIVEESISPIRTSDETISHYISIRRDVTRESELEMMLRQSQKMEAIGTLAGGIAHDFNNILCPVIGYAELTYNALAEDSPHRKPLGEVIKASCRARDLVQQILTFSRRREDRRKPLEVQQIIKEALNLLRASLPSTIRITQDIDPDIRPIMADPAQIHQVVMNLCTNAYQAMRETGGILHVGLQRCEITDGNRPSELDVEPGPFLRLSVKDTGIGIDPELIGRIFEPYFTTKKHGEGTGLGLAVVHGIVKSYGGDILVESRPDGGSRFEVYLGMVEAEDHEQEKTSIRSDGMLQGSERILIVDDEHQVAETLRDMLEGFGYRVVAKTSSVEALGVFTRMPGMFDLVITDLTMPQLTGLQLAREMITMRSGMPVILCTGFGDDETARKAGQIGIMKFITKPVTRLDLAATVREVLDGHAGNQSLAGISCSTPFQSSSIN